MSDFMLWLHANYIRPQINIVEMEDYSFHFDLVRNNLPPSVWTSLEKCLEFTAIQAFILGLRTGEGLTPLTAPTPSALPFGSLEKGAGSPQG